MISNGDSVDDARPQILHRNWRVVLWRCAQWTAALGLLVWLCGHYGDAIHEIRRTPIDVRLFTVALVCAFCSQLIMGLRWYCLIPPNAQDVTLAETCRATFLGLLSNYSPLGDYGGLTYRVTFLKSVGGTRVSEAVQSVVLDRIIGLFSLMICYGLAMLWLWEGAPPENVHVLPVFSYGTLVVIAGGVAICVAICYSRFLRHHGLQQTRQFLLNRVNWVRQLRRQIALGVGCSLASQAFAVLALNSIANAVSHGSVTPTLIQNAAVLPMVELSSMLIPTPSGIGVREFALTQLYRNLLQGVSLADASRLGFLVALALRLAVFLSTLFGFLLLTVLSRLCCRTSRVARGSVPVPLPVLPYSSSTGHTP